MILRRFIQGAFPTPQGPKLGLGAATFDSPLNSPSATADTLIVMLAKGQRPHELGPVESNGEPEVGVGARVDAVFVAAEKAAAHILALAREEADEVRRQARGEAEGIARQQRTELDQEVERVLADARRQGDEIRGQARAEAEKIEDAALVRKARLREELRLLEERAEWAREGLREVTLRLGEVFGEPEGEEPA
jgi:cell division septum initiation protein DivIVA